MKNSVVVFHFITNGIFLNVQTRAHTHTCIDGVNNMRVEGQLLSSFSPGENRLSLTTAGLMVNIC